MMLDELLVAINLVVGVILKITLAVTETEKFVECITFTKVTIYPVMDNGANS